MPTDDEISAFHSIVQTGGAASVEKALKANPALATAADKFGFQAIHLLDYTGFHDILSLLLNHGVDINAANDDGHTLLHVLIDPEFLPAVLEAGGGLTAKDNHGRTPLMLARTEHNNQDMIDALIEAGAKE
ncbi:MAG: hypothetical protein AAGF55_00550 [Pseudomonadota bacterium]